MKNCFLLFTLTAVILLSCNSGDTKAPQNTVDTSATHDSANENAAAPVEEKKPWITYSFLKRKEWQELKDSFAGGNHLDILNAINRVDTRHLNDLDSILIPSDYSYELQDYLPFPTYVDRLKNVNKILLFSYPAQVFAAYENGKLFLTGPTSMGRKTKPTPQRLYFTNWKSKRSVSTVDDAWILEWNFNVHNTWGVGFHQYDLPGYPASHSCMRLLEKDAKVLYSWADQWELKEGQLIASGTPVIVFGKYPFGKTRPWNKLVDDPGYLTLTADSLNRYIDPHMDQILKKQQQREVVLSNIQ